MPNADVIIIGAGLAGLCCARRLQEAGVSFRIVEASDGVGGRVRSDEVDGFLLDRGFQVLLTAYPETQRTLDYGRLGLRPFYPGAKVWFRGRFHRTADPWRHPLDAIGSLSSPIGTLRDKLLVARVRRRARIGTVEELLARPDMRTIDLLREDGFSDAMIERFFRPFFGGIFLERELRTSSRTFEFVFRMLSLGDTALPAAGMGAIPALLAESLPSGSLRLNSPVRALRNRTITLAGGEELSASEAIVIATEAPECARLLEEMNAPGSRSVSCVYFAADEPPPAGPIICLDGEEGGPVNNLAVLSAVAPSYAPAGQSLISATVLGNQQDGPVESAVRAQVRGWFGVQVDRWRHLRTYHIRHAQPDAGPLVQSDRQQPARVRPGVYVCGDHRGIVSIDGAMLSGRQAAETLIADARE